MFELVLPMKVKLNQCSGSWKNVSRRQRQNISTQIRTSMLQSNQFITKLRFGYHKNATVEEKRMVKMIKTTNKKSHRNPSFGDGGEGLPTLLIYI